MNHIGEIDKMVPLTQNIGIGAIPQAAARVVASVDLESLIDYAKRQHDETGLKTWVVDTKTGRRAWRSDATVSPRERRGL